MKLNPVFDFRFSCDLQGQFACTLRPSSSDRVVLLRRSPDPKLTPIKNEVNFGTGKTQKEPYCFV